MSEVSSIGSQPVQVCVETTQDDLPGLSGLKVVPAWPLGVRQVQVSHQLQCAPAGLLQQVQNAVVGGAVTMSDAQQLRTRVSAALICNPACHSVCRQPAFCLIKGRVNVAGTACLTWQCYSARPNAPL